MKTLICPTCGCSLVRLGINRDEAVPHRHESKEYYFCCDGCLERFVTDPEKYLRESDGLIVCPVCLTEKPLASTSQLDKDGRQIFFCRCPHCMDEFKKNPEYYLQRLEGKEDHPGTFKSACSRA